MLFSSALPHIQSGMGIPAAIALVAAAVLVGHCGIAGSQSLRPAERPGFRVDSDLVLVPVTVTDSRGADVTGLSKDDFRVLDNNRVQAISAFYSGDLPCSIALVLDVSGSMRDHLDREKAAVRAFVDLANSEDDFSLFTVSSAPSLHAKGVSDPIRIADRVRSATSGGATALVDAVYLAADETRFGPRKRRALLVISDGMDNHSRYTKNELLRFVEETDVQIYSIAMDTSPSNLKPIQLAEASRGIAFLKELSERTGGFSVRTRGYEDACAAAARISVAIRNQYVIGYRGPTMDGPGSLHRIEVKVDRRKARVYARSGYRAP
jgi:Ca-activated chloride channel homolog